jgi:hypothetical protein
MFCFVKRKNKSINLMDIKTESESENITHLSWVCCTMYDNAKSAAFAFAVKN